MHVGPTKRFRLNLNEIYGKPVSFQTIIGPFFRRISRVYAVVQYVTYKFPSQRWLRSGLPIPLDSDTKISERFLVLLVFALS